MLKLTALLEPLQGTKHDRARSVQSALSCGQVMTLEAPHTTRHTRQHQLNNILHHYYHQLRVAGEHYSIAPTPTPSPQWTTFIHYLIDNDQSLVEVGPSNCFSNIQANVYHYHYWSLLLGLMLPQHCRGNLYDKYTYMINVLEVLMLRWQYRQVTSTVDSLFRTPVTKHINVKNCSLYKC